ncbi:hypothetical protein [Mycolicibacterium lutetiense]|uniref:Uncharacterized protein n=1 Tax=Mycolicibacterium lutetiense TaxID=1641992 RepID=A0ABS4ZYL5_9MYCO|nr:hypothetical protein [Mycolicibacterium lutetiense]MBP2454617.1 hypothetical protein [Mycolicibacterium lutetiense]
MTPWTSSRLSTGSAAAAAVSAAVCGSSAAASFDCVEDCFVQVAGAAEHRFGGAGDLSA